MKKNIHRNVSYFNRQVQAFRLRSPTGNVSQRTKFAKNFADKDPTQFHWDEKNYRALANYNQYHVEPDAFRIGVYRPFFKQNLYFSKDLNNSIRQFPEIYPSLNSQNVGIYITGSGSSVPFSVLATTAIADTGLTSGNGSSPYISRYRYVQSLTGKLQRVSNIDPAALKEFRQHFGDASISEDDLFYFTYGVLHSEQYRATFANDLAKSPARIPMAGSLADFRAFVAAGRRLAHLHVNYESVAPYPLQEIHTKMWHEAAPDAYRVEKMKYAGKRQNQDKSTIIYNAGITLSGIPAKAHDYRLGTRSALDWLIDRYRVKTDKKSGITNDVNDWADELGEPRYILDLIKRVTTVSIETVDIVNSLPELPV